MASDTEQTPEGASPPQTDFDLEATLKLPAMAEHLQTLQAAWEGRVEKAWRPQVDEAKTELGKKSATWAKDKADLQQKIDDLTAQLEVAQLSDDKKDIAVFRSRLVRREQELATLESNLAHTQREILARRTLLDIAGQYPGLAPEFQEQATRRLLEGVPSYVIEREARKAVGAAPAPKTEAAPAMVANLPKGSSRTPKQIMDDYIQNPTPETRRAYEAIRG